MRTPSRLASLASCVAIAALAAGCTTERIVVQVPAQPVAVIPAAMPATFVAAPFAVSPVASAEFGRITNIEYFANGTATSRVNVPGAIVGGVAGAVIGHQVGSGGGREAATVLGGAAGAAIGSQVGRTTTTSAAYRVTLLTESGVYRTYDVPATGDLRVGDRVRVENGVIYLS